MDEERAIEFKCDAPKIYPLIGEAMREIRAVGKDSVNETQGFKYRGIDAVMNALNPVMSKLGLFIVPEVLEQVREDRETTRTVFDKTNKCNKDVKSLIKYSILKIRYTLFAPDGSNVSCVVIGEGMDGGDKASNKAMAVGLKYACFQIFMIPTEEMAHDDPDRESFEITDVTPARPTPPAATNPTAPAQPAKKDPPAQVEKTQALPPAQTTPPVNPVLEYIAREREALRVVREMSKPEHNALFKKQYDALVAGGVIPAKKYEEMTQAEAELMIDAMYKNFQSATSPELKA